VPVPSQIARRSWPVFVAAVATMCADGAAQWLQMIVMRDAHPSIGEIRSVSDLVLGTGFGVALYLWMNLRATRAALTAAERSRIVLDTQLALAAEVQRRLLPAPPDPSQTPNLRWATRLRPAWKIGGDFYDFIPAADGGTLVLVGDVSGKGIPAALLQTSAHALFRTYARRVAHPAELLRLVSREVFAENGGVLYLTCIAAHLDLRRGIVTYVNAGHPSGLLIGPSGKRLLDKGGMPIGMFAEALYRAETLPIEGGDVAVLVTDGITEAVEQDDIPAVDRLLAAFSAIEPPITADRVCDAIMSLGASGAGPRGIADWDDDKTVVVFEVQAAPT
jgi:sigma-B regulation protein RsbU (phosphoserine phosphatase)